MVEVNRLYRIIGSCEQRLEKLQPPNRPQIRHRRGQNRSRLLKSLISYLTHMPGG